MSKTKKALEILNRQLKELNIVTNVLQGNTWKASLKDTLNIYIGPGSSISTRLDSLYFTNNEQIVSDFGVFDNHVYDDSNKENFRHLISNAIKHIESNGIYTNTTLNNFLGGFNNTEIISGIVVGAGILLGIGSYLGRFEKEREIIQLNKTIDSKDAQINELESGQNAELNTYRIENKNLKDTYQNIYEENERLKKGKLKRSSKSGN
jgi:hypothetical protein